MSQMVSFNRPVSPFYKEGFEAEILAQISRLEFKGTIFIEHRFGKVSEIPYACSDKCEIIRMANLVFRDGIDVVRVSVPALNIVLYR